MKLIAMEVVSQVGNKYMVRDFKFLLGLTITASCALTPCSARDVPAVQNNSHQYQTKQRSAPMKTSQVDGVIELGCSEAGYVVRLISLTGYQCSGNLIELNNLKYRLSEQKFVSTAPLKVLLNSLNPEKPSDDTPSVSGPGSAMRYKFNKVTFDHLISVGLLKPL